MISLMRFGHIFIPYEGMNSKAAQTSLPKPLSLASLWYFPTLLLIFFNFFFFYSDP